MTTSEPQAPESTDTVPEELELVKPSSGGDVEAQPNGNTEPYKTPPN
jgi:hypothetical protein